MKVRYYIDEVKIKKRGEKRTIMEKNGLKCIKNVNFFVKKRKKLTKIVVYVEFFAGMV